MAQTPPEDILREVPSRERLPKGTYRLIRSWEAETPANHNTGHAAADADASGGNAWEARSGADTASKHLIFGPYLETPAGDYVAFFRLKLLDQTEDDVTAQLDASVGVSVKILAARDVWTGDLSRERYAQIPLAFRSPGGKLECRLFWNGYAGVRLDKVTLFALEGGGGISALRAPSASPSGKPDNLPYRPEARPFPDVFPHAPKPASRLTVMDLRNLPTDRRMALLSLQGLVNREQPSLYALLDETDRQWLDWMKSRKWIEGEDAAGDPMVLIARYREKIKGVVLCDPRLSSTKNVAMMIASVKDGLVVSPRLARELGLPVLDDLRGRWKTNAEAYRWAFDHLWPQLNHFVLACLYPDDVSGLRDYLYQQRVFTFWITGPIDGAQPGGDPTAEARLMEEILAKYPANIPVMGFPWAGDDVGIGEGGGVRLFAQYGKFLVGSVSATNLSLQSGFPAPELKQRRPPAPELQPNKVYLTWLMSDGDNLPVLSRGNFPQLWRDKAHGRVPIAWSFSPCAALLMPAVADYYYANAGPADAFVGAVSGVGYTYPDDYGQRFEPEARKRVFDGFLTLTREYLARSDLRQIWIMNATREDLISRYASDIPDVDGIFPDYGRRLSRYDEAFYPTARGVPVFHAVTNWEEGATRQRKSDLFVEQIRAATPTARPAFLHAFIWNWGADLSTLPEVMERLGSQYIAVRPDHLAALASQALARSKIVVRCAPSVMAIEGQEICFQASAFNATNAPLAVSAKVAEGLDGAKVEPARAEIPALQSQTFVFRGKPQGKSLKIAFHGVFGEASNDIGLQIIPSREVAGALPQRGSLRYADRFVAAELSHRSGVAQADGAIAGGKIWVAKTGETEAGHVIFGPYKPLPPGRYLALFRLKRIGEGVGELARIDVHAADAKTDAAARAITTAETPLNAWRAFPLEFTHPGGALETRVYWPGKASLAVSEIVLWEITQ
ncbi:MAG: GxGYxYP family putative glycoside hydrolase [Candidatus Sumerlaeota bacterium]|nr:GxGYxYP family putative glycoside hydrolase [Candidatus Sumerlaeota bacterium]